MFISRKSLLFSFIFIAIFLQYVQAFSSFWEPLYNPRILNYKVDAKFDPDGGKKARESYEKENGYRGRKLIENLGNDIGPSKEQNRLNQDNDVVFYYTYKGLD